MLAFMVGAALATSGSGAGLIAQQHIRAKTTRYSCGTVTALEVGSYGPSASQLEFVIDGRDYFLLTPDALPQMFSAFASAITASATTRQPVRVGWEPDRADAPIVRFIDFPAPAGDRTCERIARPATTGK